MSHKNKTIIRMVVGDGALVPQMTKSQPTNVEKHGATMPKMQPSPIQSSGAVQSAQQPSNSTKK
ncbi:hypothetical protein ACKVM9_004187 [Pantoea agglomerans]|uniref:hypothetical protein n=1 Tax=Enterobacter agglomerans TaxID=549 RepID=UPI0027918274|nr:hypothetical protein [Pantoea agglomerans]MDQ0549579.1 hypothetical protein [Pantoea agglomerans]